MNSANFPDIVGLLEMTRMPDAGMVGQQRFAAGGMVPHFAQGGLADWYQQLYGPVGVTQTDAVSPFYAPIFGPSGQVGPYDLGGPGAPGGGSTGAPSGPTEGVNATSSGIGNMAVDAITSIAAIANMPGIGVVAAAPAIANMLGLVSSIAAPGIATVDVNHPNPNINDVIANMTAQTNAASVNGIATGNTASNPNAVGVDPSAVAVGPQATSTTPGQTAEGGGAGSGVGEGGGGVGPGGGSGDATSGGEGGSWARGGHVRRGLAATRGVGRPQPVSRGALGHVR